MKNEDYIKKWLEGTLTEEERRVFEASDDHKSLDRLSKAAFSFKAPPYDADKEWERLEGVRSSKGKVGRVVAMRWINPLLKVAAIFVLLSIGYLYLIQDSQNTVKTMSAEKVNIFLPDSSFVALNVASHLTYPGKDWAGQRKVSLEGEAFFRVAKGSRFDVETKSGIVSVLGTEFNVKHRDGYFEVICYEGLVRVQNQEQVVELAANDMFRIINGAVVTEKLNLNALPSWMKGKSSFESVPYEQVIKEFERQYNVSITTENIDTGRLFTGGFVHDNITLALKSITLPVNINYQIEENKRVILSGDSGQS